MNDDAGAFAATQQETLDSFSLSEGSTPTTSPQKPDSAYDLETAAKADRAGGESPRSPRCSPAGPSADGSLPHKLQVLHASLPTSHQYATAHHWLLLQPIRLSQQVSPSECCIFKVAADPGSTLLREHAASLPRAVLLNRETFLLLRTEGKFVQKRVLQSSLALSADLVSFLPRRESWSVHFTHCCIAGI